MYQPLCNGKFMNVTPDLAVQHPIGDMIKYCKRKYYNMLGD
jgi:hypothetical protein